MFRDLEIYRQTHSGHILGWRNLALALTVQPVGQVPLPETPRQLFREKRLHSLYQSSLPARDINTFSYSFFTHNHVTNLTRTEYYLSIILFVNNYLGSLLKYYAGITIRQ
jgi:hypothetical protein